MIEVSIIVPIFNSEKYLKRCIESIINQSFKDIEIILVNDGSTDNSGKICDYYVEKDKRIKVFHIENQGVSMARNIGLNYATGEWITFVDADDWIELNALEWAINIVNQYDIDLLCWNYVLNYGKKQVKNKSINPDFIIRDQKELKWLLLDIMYPEYDFIMNGVSIGNIRSCCTKLFRRKIIYDNKIRFMKELIIAEDAHFCMEYMKLARKVLLVNKYLYHYRFLNDSADRRYRPNVNDINTKVMEVFYNYVIENSYNNNYLNCYMGLGYDCICKSLLYYFVNKSNNKKFLQLVKELKSVLKSDYYKKAFKPKIFKGFSLKEKIIIYLAKKEHATILFMVGYAKKIIDDLKKGEKRYTNG
ncbi:MAG: glycosyltransferase [Clostridiales bacterium]|nr:glycosyltransferase [Clostridiales bacterium]